jgi:hypothetical protein
MTLTPQLMLSMWAAGIAAGGALVGWWRVVGPGYLWLTGGVAAATAILAGLAGGGLPAYVGAAAVGVGALLARSRVPAVVAFGGGAVALVIAAAADSPVIAALTGSALLGAITSEMMLGHWFLVDPRLPRWPLHTLDAVAFGALVADAVVIALSGSIVFSGADGPFGLTYVMLAGFTGVLMVGVWFSLEEPRYSGVMAATGLSYLAVLTTFGVVTVGRFLVSAT